MFQSLHAVNRIMFSILNTFGQFHSLISFPTKIQDMQKKIEKGQKRNEVTEKKMLPIREMHK